MGGAAAGLCLRIKLRQGEKGTLKAEYLHARVWAWDRKEETARHWHLLVRRECGADTPSHFVFSNADASTSLSRLARMHGCRFFIEHAFREAKSELAMADYQVRRWDAWHRHMALVMVAMLFLLKERLAQAEAPMLSLALVMAINQLLTTANAKSYCQHHSSGRLGCLPPAGVGNMTK